MCINTRFNEVVNEHTAVANKLKSVFGCVEELAKTIRDRSPLDLRVAPVRLKDSYINYMVNKAEPEETIVLALPFKFQDDRRMLLEVSEKSDLTFIVDGMVEHHRGWLLSLVEDNTERRQVKSYKIRDSEELEGQFEQIIANLVFSNLDADVLFALQQNPVVSFKSSRTPSEQRLK